MPVSSLPNTKHIRAILFDKDGTLIDFNSSWGPINRRIADFAALGDPVLSNRLLDVCGMDPQTQCTRADSLFAAGNADEIAMAMVAAGSVRHVADLARYIDRAAHAAASDVVPVTDLATFFAGLKARGLATGIASSDCRAAIAAMADHFKFTGYLALIAGYDSGFGTKPGPGMVHAFSSALALHPVEIAVVGDNTHDMVMARSAGAGLCIGVLTGTGSAGTLGPLADIVVENITDILPLLPASCALQLARSD